MYIMKNTENNKTYGIKLEHIATGYPEVINISECQYFLYGEGHDDDAMNHIEKVKGPEWHLDFFYEGLVVN